MFSGELPSALPSSTSAPYARVLLPGLRSAVSVACSTTRGQVSPVQCAGKTTACPLPCGVTETWPPLRVIVRSRWPLPEPSSKVPSATVVSKLYEATYGEAGVLSPLPGGAPGNAAGRLRGTPPLGGKGPPAPGAPGGRPGGHPPVAGAPRAGGAPAR